MDERATRRYYMCLVVKLHYAVVLCCAERVRTISHKSRHSLAMRPPQKVRPFCFFDYSSMFIYASKGVPKVARSQKLLRRLCLHGRNSGYSALLASGRGTSAHRLRSGLRPRAADCRPVLGIGAVPPPAAPAGCQSPVSGTGLESQRLVREALPLHARPHAMLLAHNKHRTECLVIQRFFACCRGSRPAQTTNPALASMHHDLPLVLHFWLIVDRPWS